MSRRRRKKIDKAVMQKRHFLRRMAERFGAVPSQAEYEDLIAQVKDETVTSEVFYQSIRVWHMLVSYCDNLLRVVYDRSRKTLVTVLYDEREGVCPGWPVAKRDEEAA